MSYEPTVWVDGDHVTSAKLNKLEQGVNSMSYTPTVWNAGDVVTAEKLNKLEQGVAEGGGGEAVIPEVTMVIDSETGDGTYTSTVSYDKMLELIRNSNLQIGGENSYPALLTDASIEDDPFSFIIGMQIVDESIQISNFYLHADGTVSGDR